MTAMAQRTRTHTVAGGNGLKLHVREWGIMDAPPILFIHGWSQNHLCWAKQYQSELADRFRLVAYRPTGPRDVRGSARTRALHGRPALGGRRRGCHRRAGARPPGARGLVLRRLHHRRLHPCSRPGPVPQLMTLWAAASSWARPPSDRCIGPGFLDHFADLTANDLPTNIRAVPAFVRGLTAKPLAADEFESALCCSHGRTRTDPREPSGPRDRRRRRRA